MKIILLLTAILLFADITFAQEGTLSSKHLNKIENAKSASKKLKLYKKFYTRDSARISKDLDKYWEQQSDSIFNAIQDNSNVKLSKRDQRLLKRASGKISDAKSLKGKTLHLPDSAATMNQISDKVKDNLPPLSVPHDSAEIKREVRKAVGVVQSQPAMNEVNGIANEAKSYSVQAGQYKNQITGLAKNDSASRAELKRKALVLAQSRTSRFRALSMLEQQKESMKQLQNSSNEYKEQSEQLQDSAYLKEKAKEKAEEAALDYLAKNPAVMDAIARKTALLMKVYSIVPNSNDLRTAVKRSSLEGRSFKDRIFLGGNFQILNLKPVSIEASPVIGYRLTSRLITGLGMNFRKTFNDTLSRIASNMIGYKIFVSYDVIQNFFGYSEFSRNAAAIEQTEGHEDREWNSAFLIGVGRKISLHPRLDMTAIILYNVTHRSDNSVYSNRWSFRIGFQTSALGFIKKKPEFNPR